ALSALLEAWGGRFEQALVAALVRRLGIAPGLDDRALAGALIRALATRAATIDRILFDWRGGRDPGADAYSAEQFRALAALLDGRGRAPTHPYWSGAGPCSLHIAEVEAIWAAIAERDDWQPFNDKVTAIRAMGGAMGDDGAA
ncbi:MAG: selenoprotein O, partial [Sphingomicrobium sp.]